METSLRKETKYCAFIDVLGYGQFVLDDTIPINRKIHLLQSIYVNLATHFSMVINELNDFYRSDLYLRSFSDSFYLDCSNPEVLIIAVKTIFEYTFGFYANFSENEERTPLLRCGIVKDWLLKFRDIGAITNGGTELNPVGRAVVRAYNTSEKSLLSGMRIIISPEVFNDLNALQSTFPDFKCFVKEIMTYKVSMYYYFKHITRNERKERGKDGSDETDLYELLWPFNRIDDNPPECLDILKKIKGNIPVKEIRHYKKTVNLFLDSFLLTSWRTRQKEQYDRIKTQLETMHNEQLPSDK
jgi:hypothetical protein